MMRAADSWPARWPFFLLVLLLLLMFLAGGGSQAELASLVFLRPISALILGLACWKLGFARYSEHSFVCWMTAAIVLLVIVHLVPLPPDIWRELPGRGLVSEIDRAAALGDVWRPLSLVPSGGWNAFFALIPPLAALTLAMNLAVDDQIKLVPILLAVGFASALLGMLQLAGDPHGPAYLYRVTSEGSAVGLFANRNHQAVFLSSLFPLLAVFASAGTKLRLDPRIRVGLAVAMGALLLPLILVTGSRAGFGTMVIGLASIPFLYRGSDRERRAGRGRKGLVRGGIAVGILALVLLTMVLGRAVAVDRIIDPTAAETIRFRAWGPMLAVGMKYFPVGSGFGSFIEVFKVDEPRDLLATTYFPHAHNDWLELMITGGLPALLLLGIAVIGFLVATARWWRRRGECNDAILVGGAGLWMMLIYAVASVVDYPLRVPSLACLFCVIVVWISSCVSARGSGEGV